MATAMRLTFTIIFLLHFSHGLPIQADPSVTAIVDQLIGDKKWDDLCKLQGQIASLALEMDHENQAMFEAILEYIKVNLDETKDYDCQIPVIATVVTTSTTTESLPIWVVYAYENPNQTTMSLKTILFYATGGVLGLSLVIGLSIHFLSR